MSIPQNLLECLVVGRFLEQLHSRHAAIQDVKNHSTRSYPRCSWHRRTIIQNSPSCQYRTCPAFLPPLSSPAFLPAHRSASVIDHEYPAKPARMLGSRPLSRTTAFAPRRDSRREKPFHQERPALFVASPNHNPKLPILSISYLSRFPPPAFLPSKPARMLGSRPLSRTTAFAPRRDSRREKPFHQELPALFVASPNHNPKLPILSISYLSRFPPSRFPPPAFLRHRSASVIDHEYPAKPARMLGSRPLSRTTAFAPRRDSRREKPFHQERPALFVASPNHNPKLPILSISYLSRFPLPLVHIAFHLSRFPPLSRSRFPAFLPSCPAFRLPTSRHLLARIRVRWPLSP